ncbi:unnamed protein product [Heterobilharzia americana]|nr:unnamed protein product [Heterobilharzia americana]CAH8453724.1 unnamed protein product [Heterobilharzia americana]
MTWLDPLFTAARRGPLSSKDVFPSPSSEAAARVTKSLEREWMKESNKRNPKLWKAVLRCFWFHIFLASVVVFIDITACTLRPILLRQLLMDINDLKVSNVIYKATISGISLTLCIAVGVIAYNTSFWITYRIGMRLRIAVSGLVFKKMLSFTQKSLAETTSGDIIALLSSDVQRFEMTFGLLHYIWFAPTQIIVVFWLMGRIALIPSLCALIATILNIPFGFACNAFYSKFRFSAAKHTANRIRLLSDMIKGMKTIKVQVWEDIFSKLIGSVRRKETQSILKARFWQLFRCTQIMYQIKLITLVFISALVIQSGDSEYLLVLKSSFIYTVVNFLSSVFISATLLLPICIQNIFDTNISFKRITDFLTLPELGSDLSPEVIDSPTPFVQFSNVFAKWKNSSTTPTLQQIDFEVSGPQLVAVIGMVGSGKSSLLQAVLGELPATSGRVKRSAEVAYLPGTAWILPGSIKENILCGLPFEPERYAAVLQVTALDVDITQFPNGDNTHVNERGVNLSGGQKARIGLARVAYSRTSFVLLDDPLSAVDVHVAGHLFQECIVGFMANRLRVLVTHQLHFLPKAENIIFLKEGRICEFGTYSDLCAKGVDFSSMESSTEAEDTVSSHNDKTCNHVYSKIEESCILNSNQKFEKYEQSNKLMHSGNGNQEKIAYSDEQYSDNALELKQLLSSSDSETLQREKETSTGATQAKVISFNQPDDKYYQLAEEKMKLIGDGELKTRKSEDGEKNQQAPVSWKHYCIVARLAGGFCGTFFVVLLFLLAVLVFAGWDLWLAHWCHLMDNFDINDKQDYQRNMTFYLLGSFDTRSMKFNFIVLWCLMIGLVFLVYTRAFLFFTLMVGAARRLHDKMLNACLHTEIKFFEVNPSGSIINRFSKDISQVDDVLPVTMYDAIQCFFLVLIMGAATIFMTYWCIIPTVLAVTLFYLTQRKYIRISKDLKRLESAARSPIISWLNVTIQGLPCIRASWRQSNHLAKFEEVMDNHTDVFYLDLAANRWLALRFDLLCVLFTTGVMVTSLLVCIFTNLSASKIGLMITYGLGFLGLFQWFVRQSSEVQNQMVSVERIVEYTDLPPEVNIVSPKTLLNDKWPTSGRIDFQNVSISYDKGCSWAIRNLNLIIEPGLKVGIVGRTGSGKSTLFSAILRLVKGECGKILIDNVDIQQLKLEELREKISVIPQDLLCLLVLYNLGCIVTGPTEENDFKLGKGLDSIIDEGGSNFSSGERQLLSLARAILEENRIVLVDEATANVDSRTDLLIQETLRKHFSSCTVLTITHRLQTVIDNDLIVVLENGQIKEIGSPYMLLNPEHAQCDLGVVKHVHETNEDSPGVTGDGLFAKWVRATGKEQSRNLAEMARRASFQKSRLIP